MHSFSKENNKLHLLRVKNKIELCKHIFILFFIPISYLFEYIVLWLHEAVLRSLLLVFGGLSIKLTGCIFHIKPPPYRSIHRRWVRVVYLEYSAIFNMSKYTGSNVFRHFVITLRDQYINTTTLLNSGFLILYFVLETLNTQVSFV